MVSDIMFYAGVAGVIVGVVFKMFLPQVSARMHELIIGAMLVLAVVGALVQNGSLVAPAAFIAFDGGYLAGLLAETAEMQQKIMVKFNLIESKEP